MRKRRENASHCRGQSSPNYVAIPFVHLELAANKKHLSQHEDKHEKFFAIHIQMYICSCRVNKLH